MTKLLLVACAAQLVLGPSCSGDKKPAPSKQPAKPTAKPTTEPPTKQPVAQPPAPTPPERPPSTRLPKQAEVKQGGTSWAVYLAVDKPMAPALGQATAHAKKLGYTALPGDINCTRPIDKGAPERKGDYHIVALYFASKADAEAAGNAYGTVIWTGRAKTFCLD
jgi:hypothetical protein